MLCSERLTDAATPLISVVVSMQRDKSPSSKNKNNRQTMYDSHEGTMTTTTTILSSWLWLSSKRRQRREWRRENERVGGWLGIIMMWLYFDVYGKWFNCAMETDRATEHRDNDIEENRQPSTDRVAWNSIAFVCGRAKHTINKREENVKKKRQSRRFFLVCIRSRPHDTN